MRIPRATVDILVIILAAIVGVALLLLTLGLLVAKIVNPNIDVSTMSALISNMITTIVGALVGFIGGRAVGKSEAVK
jgi:hypothetical protein